MADEFDPELVERCASAISTENDVAPPVAWDAAIAVLRASKHAELVAALERAQHLIRNLGGQHDELLDQIDAALAQSPTLGRT